MYAHRGGGALRPENTIVSFDHGLSLGADGLELDVHLSRDGIVVVHHDPMLDRTTGARGPLADRTADELARVDAGYWFRAGSTGENAGTESAGLKASTTESPVHLSVALSLARAFTAMKASSTQRRSTSSA